jgi:hypothetical protein
MSKLESFGPKITLVLVGRPAFERYSFNRDSLLNQTTHLARVVRQKSKALNPEK